MLGDSNFPFLVSETNKKTENQNENEEVKVNKAFTEPDKEHPVQEVKDGNVNVGGSEDGGWKDGNWKEDIGFEEEIKKTDNKNSGNEFHRDLGGEESYNPAESQVQGSEQSESAHPPLGTNDKSQERVGAFGLLKNAIELFSQTPNPEMNESTQTVQSFNTNSAETTEPLASFTPGLDALTDSLHTEVTHTGFPKEQAQSHPISAEKLLHNAPSVTEAKTFSKDYKSLHHHMNADETVILLELFGRHKLQFLDYILTSPEAVSADEDQSILSDIEELLQHQMEMLVAPSMKGSDAPEEDKQRTSTIIALQKLETLLKSMKDTVSTGISDVSNHQAGPSSSRTNENEDWSYLEKERDQGSKEKISLHNTKSGSKQKGLIKQSVEFLLWFAEESISSAKAVMGILVWIIVQAVSLLPDNMRPGPDLYGVPWEPVIFTGLLGLLTFLLFTSRCYRSIKSRLYRRKEQRMAKQVEELLDEKCKVLETLSQCQQEYDDLENLLRDSGVLAQTQKSEHLEVQAEQLEQTKKQLGTDLDYLKEQLAQQQEHRKEQDRKITLLEESMKACEAEAKDLQSKEEQAQTTLKIYSMSSERLQRNLETAEEENTVLQESNSQLKQEVEEWAERISELEAEMQRCEVAHSAMMQDVAVKDERITSLTDRLLQMKCWDSDLEEEEGGEKDTTNGTAGKEDTHLQKVQKLIFAAKLNADLKSVDEDKDRVFAKLNDEIKAKEDLRMSIEEMEREKLSLQSDTESYTDQVDRIQQKLQIMTEMYQENELKLHRMLTVEEKERHQKEEKLSKADKNIAMAIEELNNYRSRYWGDAVCGVVQAEQLEQTKKQLGTDLDYLKEQLAQQQEHRKEQDRKITLLEESMKACEAEAKDLQSKEEQAQTTLKIYSMSSERLQRNLETAEEENTVLQESNSQLKQEVEEWAERISELEAEMQRCEVAHSAMMQDVAVKDERITSLTDRLLQMKCWDSDLEEEEGGEKDTTNGTAGKEDTHLQKVQKLIFAAKLNADLKSVDEDKDRVFAKLNDEIKAKEDLRMSIEEMEREKLSLQSDTESYTDQVDRIQQKLQIMTEMYQENELKLHRMLTVEEKERHQKEEKLSKADKNIAMAIEELNNYRKRAEEMEEELEKTKQSYQTQISAHEKKAHNNWLAVRSAERELADIRRENALLRQKITDTQFKLDSLEKDPYALNSLARPLPFRAERSPYGPSPLSRPSSETRPFLSPPTLMDGLPGRLSPRVSRGPGEPPSGQADMERTGGPHSDSGSISPTWERDRRGPPPGPPGPLGPPGYIFPEPGGPILRRPPPGALGSFPPPGALPPGALPPRGFPLGPPHPLDMADGSFREGRQGPGDQDHRESGPGGQRTPPEMDPRMVGPPPPGPPGIPIDGPYPRRAPYGPPPPPDFYPPRIPGGPPMRHMWLPPPQGMMFPPRFPSGGPLPPGPNPNVPYGPPIRYDGPPPPSMGAPPRQQSLPSPPHSQSPEENRPSPEDAI
ncbi:PREDICTED: cTAGE family member 5 [Cyprinodon variegatus]|uniref:cTAGE family member 5 n=1 Tax=Cyprinodon variegatus TaxID=28743 RepID=UPI0007429BB6|nr:PREDICTED: cTAGE family member 5 [Cyprinodon variegatus]